MALEALWAEARVDLPRRSFIADVQPEIASLLLQGHLLAHWVTSQHQVYACTCAFMQGEKQGTYGPPPVLAIRQEGWTYYLTESGLSCPAPHSFNGLGGAAEGRWRDI